MSEVVELFPKVEPEDEPHLAGEAFCGACGHEWAGVAPVGTSKLECPNCKRWWGLFKHPVDAAEGTTVWECNCGNDLFFITGAAIKCRKCGAPQSGY